MVGIIANPASGKDIRRLVAEATTVSNQDKIGILRRVLQGLAAAGVARVLLMPDERQMARQAIQAMQHGGRPAPPIEWLDMTCTGTAQDSIQAGACLRETRAGCIIVLGGDGTVRAASAGAGDVPLLPLSTGTNNVLPTFAEPTIAGLAAGVVARGLVDVDAVSYRHKWIEVLSEGRPADRALVDLAVLRGRFSAARAVWDAEGLRWIVVTRADPATIGLSAVAGVLHPLSPIEPCGVALAIDPAARRRVLAPIGPGLVLPLGIACVRELALGEALEIDIAEPSMIALDGERELALAPGQRLTVRVRADGPRVIDSGRVMREIVSKRLLEWDTPESGEATL